MTATENCRAVQADVLASLLELNRASQFSSEHGLSTAGTPDDLRKLLPITTYDFYRSHIERLKKGDTTALLGPTNKLLMFTLSSGTTSDSKFIPVTNRFYRDYRRGWQLWGISAFDARPAMKRLRVLQISSDYNRFESEAGTPCGNISGLAAKMQTPSVRLLYTLPTQLAKITCPESKYYMALRLGLADSQVGLITTANPSTLVHLAQIGDSRKEELIRDIRDGSLTSDCDLPANVRAILAARLSKKNIARSQRLEQCVEQSGHLYPSDAWPDLQFISVWTGGSCSAYLPALKEYYGELPVRDHGLSASEGRMTIPFQDHVPDGVLDITSHFYEFIPEDEYGRDDPTILLADELQEGRNYYILLTTSSGLYRYDICDVVRCVGFCNSTPLLRFLHKGAHISSITGEKLAESQVVEAVNGTLIECGHRLDYFTLIPAWGDPPGYRLLIEESQLPDNQTIQLEKRVDQRLCELNCEYEEKRTTRRLAPVSILPLKDGSWREFARQRQSRLGGSIEQYKHPCLMPNMEAAAAAVREFGADQDGQMQHSTSNQL